MPTVIADNLYTWTVTLADGSTRTVLGSSMQTVIGGNFPSAVTSVVRGPAFATDGPPPTAAALAPATAVVGGANFTLHVTGTNFRTGASILWNGSPVPTTLVSPTEVTTPIDMSTLPAAANIPVSVRSLAGQESNALNFALTATE